MEKELLINEFYINNCYQVVVKCWNCGLQTKMRILRGKKITETACEKCSCTTLHPIEGEPMSTLIPYR